MGRLSDEWVDALVARFKNALGWAVEHDGDGATLAAQVAADGLVLTRAYRALAEEADALRAALTGLVDDEPCRLDHHGACQTHGASNPCAMAAARAALGLPAAGTERGE